MKMKTFAKPFYQPLLFLITVFCCITTVSARVKLPSCLTDNMVLQQKTSANIWGWADAGKVVTITASWDKKKYLSKVNSDGTWKTKVYTPAFGGPFSITISDGEEIRLNNILIGEVWVCSGQSNMEMPLAGWGKIQNYEQEITAANYPSIRLLQLEHVTSNILLDDAKVAKGGWALCNPQNVAGFSSVAYFFAREIYNKTRIPIGLIHTSWGGTIAEAWVSGTTLKTTTDFIEATKAIEESATSENKEEFNRKLDEWQQSFITKDAGYSNGQPLWTAAINTSDWKTTTVPSLWESNALPGFDGVVWFKKKLVVPADFVGKDLTIYLDVIDDNDITWLNGQKVGETIGYSNVRKYTVAAGLLKEGENDITVRIFDGSGGGGFYGDASKMTLTTSDGQSLSLAGDWQYKVGVDSKNVGPAPKEQGGPNRPTVLYNAMIHPLLNYTIGGAIWYQGESNADRAYQYRWLFPRLITDWRKQWNQGTFPFYFVQLANFMKPASGPEQSAWAELREAQAQTLSLPNTGMAVTIDIGEAKDIHPKNKQEVGRRLALIALAKTYGKDNAYSGPKYLTLTPAGNALKLSFVQINGGLKATGGTQLTGFEIAGADKKFYTAEATITGNQVLVKSNEVAKPVAVRYNWANNPNGNLYNVAGLPASPFRTDDWQGVTFGKK